MHIIMFVLDDPKKLDAILEAWNQVGVRGVTIMESTGIQRRRDQVKHIPMRFSFESIPQLGEQGNYTLFTIVQNSTVVKKVIEATEKIVGDLCGPNTGILTAWPLAVTKGLPVIPENEESKS